MGAAQFRPDRAASRALGVAGAIEADQVFVNVWNTGAVQTAFGGYKISE